MNKRKLFNITIQRFIFTLLFTFIVFASPMFAQKTNTAREYYIIGVARNLAPYSFLDENGLAAGYSVDITQAIAEVLHLEIEVLIAPFGELRLALKNGEIDALPMYYSENRKKIVDFTSPYSTVHNAIFIRRDATVIKTEADLHGKDIIVINGDIMHDYVLENDLTDKLVVVPMESDALQLLASGEYDCALMAQLPGLYWVKKLELSNIKTVGPLMVPSEICYAVTKGNTKLQNLLSEGLATLGETGEHTRIHNKWLGVLIPKGVSWNAILKYIIYAAIPLLVLLVMIIVWLRTLKQQVKQRTQELSESEEKLRSITENSSDYIMLVDSNLKILFINKTVPDLNNEDAIGKSINDFVPSGFQKLASDKFRSVFKTGKPTNYQTEYQTSKGDTQYFDVRLSPVIKEEKVVSVVSSSNNITERKIAEDELNKSEKKYKGILDNTQNAIFIKDLNGKYLFINKKFEIIHGISNEKIMGLTDHHIFPKEFADKFKENDLFVIKSKKFINVEESILVDGKIQTVISTKFPLYDENNNHYAICGIATDITQRKQIETELANHREHLEELIKERTSDLEEKNKELERYNRLFEDREFRIKELKDKVKELEGK